MAEEESVEHILKNIREMLTDTDENVSVSSDVQAALAEDEDIIFLSPEMRVGQDPLFSITQLSNPVSQKEMKKKSDLSSLLENYAQGELPPYLDSDLPNDTDSLVDDFADSSDNNSPDDVFADMTTKEEKIEESEELPDFLKTNSDFNIDEEAFENFKKLSSVALAEEESVNPAWQENNNFSSVETSSDTEWEEDSLEDWLKKKSVIKNNWDDNDELPRPNLEKENSYPDEGSLDEWLKKDDETPKFSEEKGNSELEKIETSTDMEEDTATLLAQELKPIIQDWLSQNLPNMVEKIVSEEVSQIMEKKG